MFDLTTDEVRSPNRTAIPEQILSHHEDFGVIGRHVQQDGQQRHLPPIRLFEAALLTRRQEVAQQWCHARVHERSRSHQKSRPLGRRIGGGEVPDADQARHDDEADPQQSHVVFARNIFGRADPMVIVLLQYRAQMQHLSAEKAGLVKTTSMIQEEALHDLVVLQTAIRMNAHRNVVQPLPFLLAQEGGTAQHRQLCQFFLGLAVHATSIEVRGKPYAAHLDQEYRSEAGVSIPRWMGNRSTNTLGQRVKCPMPRASRDDREGFSHLPAFALEGPLFSLKRNGAGSILRGGHRLAIGHPRQRAARPRQNLGCPHRVRSCDQAHWNEGESFQGCIRRGEVQDDPKGDHDDQGDPQHRCLSNTWNESLSDEEKSRQSYEWESERWQRRGTMLRQRACQPSKRYLGLALWDAEGSARP